MRWLLIAAFALLAASASFAAEDVSFQGLEESLTCQCGCGLTVHSCNHLQCPSALPLRQELREQIEKGGTRESILQYFADKYGEKILSAPTTVGFNLAAWITPFAVVAIGGIFVVVTLRRWKGRPERVAEVGIAPRPVGSSVSAAHEKILERELKGFDES